MRSMGRATGLFKRTGSGTSAQTSGCVWRIERDALDGGGVGAFAAFGEALFD